MSDYSLETATRDHVFGFRICAWSARQIADYIVQTPRNPRSGVGLIVTPNIHHIAMLRSNEAFLKAYQSAEIITCDGFPVYYYARLRDCFAPGRVTGCEIVAGIMHQPDIPAWQRLFFVLDRDVTEQAVREWAAKYGLSEQIDIVIPPMGFEHDAAQCRALAERIAAHGTTMLIMAVGAPKSEIFVDTHRDILPPCWAMGIGQAVKVELGVIRAAPQLVQKLHLEWLWRTILEPRRIGARNAFAIKGFLAAIVDDLRGKAPDGSPLPVAATLRRGEVIETEPPATRGFQGYGGRISSTLLAAMEAICRVLDTASIFLGAMVASLLMRVSHIDVGMIGRRSLLLALISSLLFLLFQKEDSNDAGTDTIPIGSRIARLIMVWGGVQALAMLELSSVTTHLGGATAFLATWTLTSLVLLGAIRIGWAGLIDGWRRAGALRKFVVVVGADEAGANVVERLVADPARYRVLGVFDDRMGRVPEQLHGIPVLGNVHDLLQFARSQLPDEVIVTLPLTTSDRLSQVIRALTALPVDLRLICQIAPGFNLRKVDYLGKFPVIDIFTRPMKDWSAVYKWLEDKVASIAILTVSLPLLALIAILVKLDSRGPVFFRQERFGFNNRIIKVLKFRTMYVDQGDPAGADRTVRNDPRVTRVGRFLRATSLDELPQFINVLRGDMSIVGPRAHAVAMRVGDSLYNEAVGEYFARHRVRPGITGWAQVHGLRGEVKDVETARKRVEYDLDYIEKWSLWLDIQIIFRSIGIVFDSGRNAY